jgi:O-antigen ligase
VNLNDTTNARPALSATVETAAWAAVAAIAALLFVIMPGLGFALGAIIVVVALAVLSQRRPEILLIGAMAAAMLGNLGRVSAVGGAGLTIYQAVFFSAVAVYLWMVVDGRERLRRSPADLWLLLLLAAAAASVTAAQTFRPAVVAFISLVSSVLLVYLVVGVASTPRRLRVTMVSLVLVAAAFGGLAVLEHYHVFILRAGNIRSHVTFKDPNTFGGILGAAAALGIPLAAVERRVWRAVVLWCAVGAAALGVVMTLSRGAFLGLVFGAVVAIFVAPMKRSMRLTLVIAGIVGILLIFFVFLSPTFVATKVTGISTNKSALYRIYLAESGLRIFRAHPFGVGPGNWQQAILAYHDPRVPYSLLASHLTYMTILVETGILGLIGMIGALIAFGVVTIQAALRARTQEVRTLASAALAGFTVLFVQSLTYSLETSKFFWFMVGAGLAAAATARTTEKREVRW